MRSCPCTFGFLRGGALREGPPAGQVLSREGSWGRLGTEPARREGREGSSRSFQEARSNLLGILKRGNKVLFKMFVVQDKKLKNETSNQLKKM